MDPWLDLRKVLQGASVNWNQQKSIRRLWGVIAALSSLLLHLFISLKVTCLCLTLVTIINCVRLCVRVREREREWEMCCFTQVHRLMSRVKNVDTEVNKYQHSEVHLFLHSLAPCGSALLALRNSQTAPKMRAQGSQPRSTRNSLGSLTSPPSHPDEISNSLSLKYSISNNTYAYVS